jgi:hypothetical protein
MAGLLAATATTVSAGHEVGRTGLRQAISDGAVIPFAALRTSIEARMAGALVDVGLYDVGDLYYRVLVRRHDGRMVSAVVDARTGRFVPVSSPVAQWVQDTARSEGRGGGILGIFAAPPATGGGAAAPGPAGGVSRAAVPAGGPPGSPQGNGQPGGTGAGSRPESVGTPGGGSVGGHRDGTSRSEAGRGNATSASASEGRGSGGARGGEASGGAGSNGKGSGGGRADRK